MEIENGEEEMEKLTWKHDANPSLSNMKQPSSDSPTFSK